MMRAMATVETNVPPNAYVQIAPMFRTNLHVKGDMSGTSYHNFGTNCLSSRASRVMQPF